MILVYAVIIVTIGFVVGFWLGRDYEKNSMLEGVVGVTSHINQYNDAVEIVSYYYSEEAYNEEVRRLKEQGIEVRDDEDE